MSYKVGFLKPVAKVVEKWKKSNPAAYKKLHKLLPELEQHPRSGTGHPEPLVNGCEEMYSRHITAHDRIVYHIDDDIVTVLITRAEGHYNDK